MNTRIWSSDTLMDIDKNQILKLKNQSIDGPEYLFLEFGVQLLQRLEKFQF